MEPKTIPLFHFNGNKATTPTCPVDLYPDLNPSSAAQSYYPSTPDCTRGAKYRIPFFLENLGPRYSEWSVNAHEARPGHHTQVNASFIELIGWSFEMMYPNQHQKSSSFSQTVLVLLIDPSFDLFVFRMGLFSFILHSFQPEEKLLNKLIYLFISNFLKSLKFIWSRTVFTHLGTHMIR